MAGERSFRARKKCSGEYSLVVQPRGILYHSRLTTLPRKITIIIEKYAPYFTAEAFFWKSCSKKSLFYKETTSCNRTILGLKLIFNTQKISDRMNL